MKGIQRRRITVYVVFKGIIHESAQLGNRVVVGGERRYSTPMSWNF
jgi:hypothetical protein